MVKTQLGRRAPPRCLDPTDAGVGVEVASPDQCDRHTRTQALTEGQQWAQATFGVGCFWGVEVAFRQVPARLMPQPAMPAVRSPTPRTSRCAPTGPDHVVCASSDCRVAGPVIFFAWRAMPTLRSPPAPLGLWHRVPCVGGFPQPKDPMPRMPRAFTANIVTMIRIILKFAPNCPAPTLNFLTTREPYWRQ